MSVTYPASSSHKSLKSRPNSWCMVKVAVLLGAGAAAWAATVTLLSRLVG